MKKHTAICLLALAGVTLSAASYAAGPGGHIPLNNPGSGPSGRSLPAMPTPNYGAPVSAPSSIPSTAPSGYPAATTTPAMLKGKVNDHARPHLPNPR